MLNNFGGIWTSCEQVLHITNCGTKCNLDNVIPKQDVPLVQLVPK